nr:MAG TPA: hypothetical protein [Caudoviricetes sp.]
MRDNPLNKGVIFFIKKNKKLLAKHLTNYTKEYII